MSEQTETERRQQLIAVVGGATCSKKEAVLAEEVGHLLAKAGVGVVCGGRGGVMAAVCRGAATEGGLTVGLLPGNETSEANPWLQVAIATGLGEARNALVARAGIGMIAIGGGHGTLSEIALACKWGKPVVSLHSWEIPGVHVVATPAEAVAYILSFLQ